MTFAPLTGSVDGADDQMGGRYGDPLRTFVYMKPQSTTSAPVEVLVIGGSCSLRSVGVISRESSGLYVDMVVGQSLAFRVAGDGSFYGRVDKSTNPPVGSYLGYYYMAPHTRTSAEVYV